MGKIENMTDFCIDIASLKTFYEKPLWGKLIEGKEYNMMFEQVIIQEKTPLNLATLKVIEYQFHEIWM